MLFPRKRNPKYVFLKCLKARRIKKISQGMFLPDVCFYQELKKKTFSKSDFEPLNNLSSISVNLLILILTLIDERRKTYRKNICFL